MGVFPTCLASGNTGLVRWPRLRWNCIKHNAFLHWAVTAKVSCNNQPASNGSCIGERRVTPPECLDSKGFPHSTPIPNDRTGYRFAGNAVPVAYFTELLTKVATALDEADCPIHITPKPDEYITYGSTPTKLHDAASLHPNWACQQRQRWDTTSSTMSIEQQQHTYRYTLEKSH
jgi:hypothetical protein